MTVALRLGVCQSFDTSTNRLHLLSTYTKSFVIRSPAVPHHCPHCSPATSKKNHTDVQVLTCRPGLRLRVCQYLTREQELQYSIGKSREYSPSEFESSRDLPAISSPELLPQLPPLSHPPLTTLCDFPKISLCLSSAFPPSPSLTLSCPSSVILPQRLPLSPSGLSTLPLSHPPLSTVCDPRCTHARTNARTQAHMHTPPPPHTHIHTHTRQCPPLSLPPPPPSLVPPSAILPPESPHHVVEQQLDARAPPPSNFTLSTLTPPSPPSVSLQHPHIDQEHSTRSTLSTLCHPPGRSPHHVVEQKLDALPCEMLRGVVGDLTVIHAEDVVPRLHKHDTHIILQNMLRLRCIKYALSMRCIKH